MFVVAKKDCPHTFNIDLCGVSGSNKPHFKKDILLIPKLLMEEHMFIGPKGYPMSFLGVAQGIGRTFDFILEIVRHFFPTIMAI
jgi:hypothetical protein